MDRALWQCNDRFSLDVNALRSMPRPDVCVIGAGITGLSSAIHLAEKGVKVAVVEASRIASGASGRSVGMVNAGTWQDPDDIVNCLGPGKGKRLNAYLSNGPDYVFSLIQRYNLAACHTQSGNLTLCHNKCHEKALLRRYHQLLDLGANVELCRGKAAQQISGSNAVQFALLDKRGGLLNPLLYTMELARVALSLGVTLIEHAPVSKIEKAKNGWWLQVNDSQINPDSVVIATNAYTRGEWSNLRNSFYPVCYFQLASQPLSQASREAVLPLNMGACDTRKAFTSFRKDENGRLLLGTVGSGKPLALYLRWARTMLNNYFDYLEPIRWEYSWSGTLGFTHNHVFNINQLDDGLYALSGYNGRGITTGTLLGKSMAEYLTTGDDTFLPLPITSMPTGADLKGKIKAVVIEGAVGCYHAGKIINLIK